MKNTSIDSKVKKATSDELLATSRLLKASVDLTPASSPNVQLAKLVEKELNSRIKAGKLVIIERF